MIIVDVAVPAMDAEYDFMMNEESTAEMLVEELTEMICQREKLRGFSQEGTLMLCHAPTGAMLPPNKTLRQMGVKTGDKLVLV